MKKKKISPFTAAVVIWAVCVVGMLWLAARPQIKYIEVPAKPQIVYVEKKVEREVKIGELPYYKTIADNITPDEIDLLAKLAFEEAGNQSLLGQRAVIEVVLNRVNDSRYPNTIREVIYQDNPTQFTPAYKLVNTVPSDKQYEAVQDVLSETVPVLQPNVLYFSTGTNGYTKYEKIGAHYFCY